jgi:hypothetical protein
MIEVAYAKCCRIWPIVRFGNLQRCGICKQVPIVVQDLTQEQYKQWKEDNE